MVNNKEKHYIAENAQLIAEWDWEKNNRLRLYPNKITTGSNVIVWWKCALNHEWQARVANRVDGKTGCPYCSGNKVLHGFNDLLTQNPNLAEEWDTEKNEGLLPSMVSLHSGRKVWWVCDKGHEWQATVANRVNGRNCPYCSGKKILSGYNDLATLYPEIASEWHPTKNINLLPSMISSGSHKSVWWTCRKGHDWQSTVYSRTQQKTGCPVCHLERQTSFPEQAILYYCSKVTVAESRYMDGEKEIDIYLPLYRIGIEYNGVFWHKDKAASDKKKVDYFAKKNIRIITIVESTHNRILNDNIEYVYNATNKDSLNWAIQSLFELIHLEKTDIDTKLHTAEIHEQYITIEKECSLASKYPLLAKQWNYDKNISIKPDMISPYSNKKVWWVCNEGHEWQAVVSSRTSGGNGCPYCSGQKVITGYNDLATLYPEIASEWHPTKNGDILPTRVSAKSKKVAFWICPKCKNDYQSEIYHRTSGRGCPYCSSKKIISGFNDLASQNPNLAAEWNMQRNENLLPSMVSLHSGKKYGGYAIKGMNGKLRLQTELVEEDVRTAQERKYWRVIMTLQQLTLTLLVNGIH